MDKKVDSKVKVGIEFENNCFNFDDQCQDLHEFQELLGVALKEINEPILRIVFSNNGNGDLGTNNFDDIVNSDVVDGNWLCTLEEVIQVANQAIAESRKSILNQIHEMQILMH